ncbi:MAG TPA: L-threonylcarbamoyladenylate synthase [Terriglobales bacterium]|nr:L-threonylcarbamoyladenylate synthase [Terriglobales bacterium]
MTLHLYFRPGDALEAHPAIAQCAAILRGGGLVAMPTETVYGLAANALNTGAVQRIFTAKQRPAWDPLIVHVSSFEMIPAIATGIPAIARSLADSFWPGPLTLLLSRAPQLPLTVTAGRDTVAVRMPSHPVARALIAAAGVPLAAPSANLFGSVSPTTADHVLHDLAGRIDAVLDAGETTVGVESTVLDPLCTPPCLLRPGGITREQIEAAIGPIAVHDSTTSTTAAQPSPGLVDRHYAPSAKMKLVEGTPEGLRAAVQEFFANSENTEYLGLMAPEAWIEAADLVKGGLVIFDWGQWGNWPQLAHNLFAGLRYLDKPGVAMIVCPLPAEEGMGLALRDRLMRAAR